MLVVDDDRMQVTLLTALLKRAGFRVLSAPSGVAALAALKGSGKAIEAISILVSDLDMPGMDGLEFAREIQRQNPAIRTLFVTANADALFKSGKLLGEGEAFLSKPVTEPLLREAVNMLLHGNMR